MDKVVLITFVAVAVSCSNATGSPSAPSSAPSHDRMLQANATPEPVAPGSTLTYAVSPASLGDSVLTLHLAAGVGDVRTSGAGWSCRQTTRAADDYQSTTHLDVDCSSAVLGATPRLVVTVKAPSSPGAIRACAVGRGSNACVTSTIGP